MISKAALINEIIKKEPRLSKDQIKAVTSSAKYLRIVAGAGAGKTETIARKIAYILLIENIKPSSIVAFTFTEKAAQSMKNRIYRTVEDIAGSNATATLGEMYIGTIHGYAKRVLEDHFKLGNYSVLDDNQEMAFILRHGWNLGVSCYESNYAESCRTFIRTVNMVWDELIDKKDLSRKAMDFYRKMKNYEDILDEHKQLTFGNMLYRAVTMLQKMPSALKHVERLIVDEYQDINKAQAEFINIIGRHGNIFIVGDPRQTVYQWRGSNVEFFERFSKTFRGIREINIRENRRSVRRIVQNANKFTESFERTRYDSMVPTRKDDGFCGIVSHQTPEDEAHWIVAQIENLTRGGKIKYSDIGILMRSVSTSGGFLIDKLRARGIPYVVGGKIGLFRRDEGQAMGRIFSWLWDDGFWVKNPWKWQEQIKGDELLTTALELWGTAQNHGIPPNAEDILREIKQKLKSKVQQYKNFTQIYHDVLTALGFNELEPTDVNDAAVMANLGRFHNLLTDYESANRFGGRTPHWEIDLKGLCWFMNSHAVRAYEEQQSDDIRGVEAIQIMTVHQAKGLEWPIVFLMSTIDGRFPSRMVGEKKNWCGLHRDMFDVHRYEGNIEDERRLFYVAITRPKDALIISYFKQIKNAVSRSCFIDNLDSSLLTEIQSNQYIPSIDIKNTATTEEMRTFTAGEIITYNICPYMYLLGNVWGFQPSLNQSIGFGNSIHYCLRRAGELVKDENYDPVNAVASAVDDYFHVPYAGGVFFERLKKGARKMLTGFVQKYGNDLHRIEEVEYRLEYPIQNATITGKVDVILKDGGELEVRDYKTSEKARTFEEICTQIRLYTSGLQCLGRPVKTGSVVYLEDERKEPNVKSVNVDSYLLDIAKKNAEMTIDGIVKGRFNASPGKQNCKRCDHKPICKWSKD